jgi:hypothetical protein
VITTSTRLPRRALLLVVLAVLATVSCPQLFSGDTHQENKKSKPFAVLFGTVLDKNNHAVYGVKVKIREAGHKKPQWELVSDHEGEFAQRVPPGKADYVISADTKGKGPRPEVIVHVANDERVDFFLHLTE